MFPRLRSPRIPFCLAVAWAAAAIADPMVEAVSNAGIFGRHVYTDHSNIDVVPGLACAGLFAIVWLIGAIRRGLAGGGNAPPAWILESTSALSSESIAGLLPRMLAVQVFVLFAMESCEQLIVAGHLLGGTIWLGGPILFSLAVHAIVCVAVASIAARSLAAFARTLLQLIRFVRRLTALLRPAGGFTHGRTRETPRVRLALFASTLGQRAPPRSALVS